MPTHQINSNAAETSASGEKSCFSKTVYLQVYNGERMAFADYTSRGAVAVITFKNSPPVMNAAVIVSTARTTSG